MASPWQLDPRGIIFPITKPPPKSWSEISLVHGRVSRHWGLIRGLIEEQKRARKNRCISSARLSATIIREVVTRLSLSLEAVDTKDKFSSTPGVGEMIHKTADKYLEGQVTARNNKHMPPSKTFVGSAAAILVAMSREATRRLQDGTIGTVGGQAETVWLGEQEVRALAAPLCEEDLTLRGDEIVLGDVENFAWCSMGQLCNAAKFDCVRIKDLDEKATIAKLEELGRRPLCRSMGCDAYATKSVDDLSDRVKIETFLRTVYCKEHHEELRGGSKGSTKRKRAGAKGKGKGKGTSDEFDFAEIDSSPSRGDPEEGGDARPPPPPKRASVSGKIKAEWYRRLLGEALLRVELDRLERSKGADAARKVATAWRKEFAKSATNLYALTPNGKWVAEKLEKASAGGKTGGAATASPILNRSSYASSSERDGGGGGGTAASPQNGHSPLAPTRAGGAAMPGVRLLIDNREKRGATANSQLSELTSFLNGRGVPYEVREWKCGDYGWVIQPDAGRLPSFGEVGYEKEYVVPRLLERKRVDDLAESIKDGRLVRQKKAMLRARSSGVMSDIEIHMEGTSRDARFQGEIYRRGLTPEDLEAALHRSAADGFKIVHHRCFADFSAYLADATLALQKEFDSKTMAFEAFWTWQNFVRFCKGQEPLTPDAAAAANAAAAAKAAAKAARGGRRGRPPMAGGRPPLPPGADAAGPGLRQRTLDGAFGITGRAGDGPGTGGSSGSKVAAGDARAARIAGGGDGAQSGGLKECRYKAAGDHFPPDAGSASDSSDGCSVVEVRGGGKVASLTPGGGGSGGGSGSGRQSPTTLPSVAAGAQNESPHPTAAATSPKSSVGPVSDRLAKWPRHADARCGREADDRGGGCISGYSGCSNGDSRWAGPRPSMTTTTKKARSLSFADDEVDVNGGSGGGSGGGGGGGGRGGGGSSRGGDSSGGNGGAPDVLECDLSDTPPSPLLPCSSAGVGSVATSAGRHASLDRDATNAMPRAGGASACRDGGGRHVGAAPRESRTGVAGGGSANNSSGDVLGSGSFSARSGAAVVDLSLDSPSPPPPPRSRTHAAAQPPPPQRKTGVGGGRSAGGDGAVESCSLDDGAVEYCSSDDEFLM